MKIAVVIPAHNEAAFLPQLLASLAQQTNPPEEVVVVDDHSTDDTTELVLRQAQKLPFLRLVRHASSELHAPGEKVVNAFNAGVAALVCPWDILVKLDADLTLPTHYFETLALAFQEKNLGISGGYIFEQDPEGVWQKNHPMHHDHVRGALKAYRRACFEAMGGLRVGMGWDTVDEHLAHYHGFKVQPIPELQVKHHRPLGKAYGINAARLQGKAFYQMRYGALLSVLAALKHSIAHSNPLLFFSILKGYFNARKSKTNPFVNEFEGRFLRRLRWKKMFNRKGV